MPTQFINVMIDISREERYKGPEVRVRYMNTGKIKGSVNGKYLKHSSWGWVDLEYKDFNANPNERQELTAVVGITSNLMVWASLGLSAITYVVTSKTLMPAAITFISF